MNDTSQHILALFAAPQHGFVPSDPPVAMGYVTLDGGIPSLSGSLQKRDTAPCVRWTDWFELHLSGTGDGKALYAGSGITVPINSELLPAPPPHTLHAGLGELR